MGQTNIGLDKLVLSVVLFGADLVAGFNAVAGTCVEHGALAEVVLIAGGKTVVVAFMLFLAGYNAVLFEVRIVAADRDEAACSRNLSASPVEVEVIRNETGKSRLTPNNLRILADYSILLNDVYRFPLKHSRKTINYLK